VIQHACLQAPLWPLVLEFLLHLPLRPPLLLVSHCVVMGCFLGLAPHLQQPQSPSALVAAAPMHAARR